MTTEPTRTDPRPEARTGIWFVGARGSVATTATIGALAMSAGLADRTGLVSELEPVAAVGLVDLPALVTGGHDVISDPLTDRAQLLADSGVFPTALVRALSEELAEADSRIRLAPRGATQRETLERIEADIRAFREENDLVRVIVVDVSNTEAPAAPAPALETLEALERALDAGESPLPVSSSYTYAAYRAGCPVVAFTPSPGPAVEALVELAQSRGLPWAGRDGKTGETLVKTTLAPLFATRNLAVRSWASYNLLGGGDGRALADPVAVASKTATKGAGVDAILGHHVDGPLRIDYVEDKGDWKTARDHITIEGLRGTKMTMQFTRQGSDSTLASPLVLDLVRLVARAHEAGEVGPLSALGFFFKEPIGSTEHSVAAQWTNLIDWCAKLALPR